MLSLGDTHGVERVKSSQLWLCVYVNPFKSVSLCQELLEEKERERKKRAEEKKARDNQRRVRHV